MTIPAQHAPDISSDNLSSPRLIRLRAALQADQAGAVQAFWEQVTAEGAPLIEPCDDDPHMCTVTFVWREQPYDDLRAVLVVINTFSDRYRHNNDLTPCFMTRLAGTDVWYRSFRLRADLRASYQLLPYDRYRADLTIASGADRAVWRQVLTSVIPDPLNPRTLPGAGGRPPSSILELPAAPAQPWCVAQPQHPAGSISEHLVRSTILDNQRRVWVYTPPGYHADNGPYALLVLFDGSVWSHEIPIAPTLDNLIAAERIPPLIAIMPDAIDANTRVRELACHAPFVDFLVDELLPWANARWQITADPARTIVAGQSFGGLTAAFAGLRAPERFGNLLAQSGSFWWQDGGDFDRNAEWLTRQFAIHPRLPLRFYVEVGLQEWMLLAANRHLRDVLDAREYELSYREYNGGHDYLCWRGGLADGLLALTQRWI